MSSKYYSPSAIDKKNAVYNLIIGERSNGKTYAMLKKALQNYWENGGEMGYVRRWQEDIKGRRAASLFSALEENGEIYSITNGEFEGVKYYAGRFYLCNYNDKGKAVAGEQDVFCYAFSLSDSEHDKSTSFPNINLIIFDEFITNKVYLPDEFVLFMNVVSTIVRKREDVKIYMLGNTVNKYCPYFTEMGLNNVLSQKQGTIDVYRYGESDLKVAVEYCKSTGAQSQKTHKYFAFNNPKLEMITGGAWEINLYPHLPYKYKPKDVLLTFFIVFNDENYQCEIVQIEDEIFTYIHRKTTPLKYPDLDIIYSFEPTARLNWNQNILKPMTKVQEKIAWFFKHGKVFYQDNDVGDAINNYLKICRSPQHV